MKLAAISIGAMLSILQMSGSANAQMDGAAPMRMQPSASDRSFRQSEKCGLGVSPSRAPFQDIEQPLPIKVRGTSRCDINISRSIGVDW